MTGHTFTVPADDLGLLTVASSCDEGAITHRPPLRGANVTYVTA